jgi:hypothetical protein
LSVNLYGAVFVVDEALATERIEEMPAMSIQQVVAAALHATPSSWGSSNALLTSVYQINQAENSSL